MSNWKAVFLSSFKLLRTKTKFSRNTKKKILHKPESLVFNYKKGLLLKLFKNKKRRSKMNRSINLKINAQNPNKISMLENQISNTTLINLLNYNIQNHIIQKKNSQTISHVSKLNNILNKLSLKYQPNTHPNINLKTQSIFTDGLNNMINFLKKKRYNQNLPKKKKYNYIIWSSYKQRLLYSIWLEFKRNNVRKTANNYNIDNTLNITTPKQQFMDNNNLLYYKSNFKKKHHSTQMTLTYEKTLSQLYLKNQINQIKMNILSQYNRNKKHHLKKKIKLLKNSLDYKKITNLVFLRIMFLSKRLLRSLSKDNRLKIKHFLKRIFNLFYVYMHYLKVRHIPSAIFFFNPYNIDTLLSETNAFHLPTISLADTDTKPYLMTYPISSNDNSVVINTFYCLILFKLITRCYYKKFYSSVNY